jgi:hypothetical protein
MFLIGSGEASVDVIRARATMKDQVHKGHTARGVLCFLLRQVWPHNAYVYDFSSFKNLWHFFIQSTLLLNKQIIMTLTVSFLLHTEAAYVPRPHTNGKVVPSHVSVP